jgi:MFS family permease
MKKAILIIGIVSFVVFMGLTLLFPPCTLCTAVLAGAGAGWLAAYWSQPRDQGQAAGIGAQAGAISGIGALLGQVLGGVLNTLLIGPETAVEIYEALELYETLGLEGIELGNEAAYYAGAIGGQVCCGLFNVAIMAGLGALGAFLYFKYNHRNESEQPNYSE